MSKEFGRIKAGYPRKEKIDWSKQKASLFYGTQLILSNVAYSMCVATKNRLQKLDNYKLLKFEIK
jgi:hypothetical protein